MTDDMMSLKALLEKTSDAELLRDPKGSAKQQDGGLCRAAGVAR